MTETTNSPAYEAASQAHRDATRAYQTALVKYRALEIGDDEFLTARGLMTIAHAAFDAAFDTEASR